MDGGGIAKDKHSTVFIIGAQWEKARKPGSGFFSRLGKLTLMNGE